MISHDWHDIRNAYATLNTKRAKWYIRLGAKLLGSKLRTVTKPDGTSYEVKEFLGKEYLL